MKIPANAYCYGKVAPPHSALYYSLRKLNDPQRDQVVAIHAFYREIEDILFECQDHELALIKYNWWRTEVAKLSLEKPSHPVMLLLKQNINSRDLEKAQNRLLKIIDGFEQNSISPHFATFEEVVVHWIRTAGERELLFNELLHNEEIISNEIIFQLMLVIELVNYIQRLRLYTRHNVFYFSADELQQFAVTEAMLQEYLTTDAIKKLLQHQAEKVERAYATLKALSKSQRKALSHLVVRCEIAYKLLGAIRESDFEVLENLIMLTPIRYWWIAFRA